MGDFVFQKKLNKYNSLFLKNKNPAKKTGLIHFICGEGGIINMIPALPSSTSKDSLHYFLFLYKASKARLSDFF